MTTLWLFPLPSEFQPLKTSLEVLQKARWALLTLHVTVPEAAYCRKPFTGAHVLCQCMEGFHSSTCHKAPLTVSPLRRFVVTELVTELVTRETQEEGKIPKYHLDPLIPFLPIWLQAQVSCELHLVFSNLKFKMKIYFHKCQWKRKITKKASKTMYCVTAHFTIFKRNENNPIRFLLDYTLNLISYLGKTN